MPLYEYKAYSNTGKKVDGLIDAPSRSLAFEKLKKRGIMPMELSEEAGDYFRSGVKTEDLVFALSQLSTLLRAGIPLPQALESLTHQTENDNLKRSFARIRSSVIEGESFAGAMAEDKAFPPLLVKMVEAGEEVGVLDTILERFSEFLEKDADFRKKVVAALVYPTIILIVSVALIIFILTYIAPTLTEIFKTFKKAIPTSTMVLLTVGTFLKNNAVVLAGALIGSIIVYVRFIPRELKDTFKLRLPVYGKIHLSVVLSRWARTLAMLHGGGVTLLHALSSARDVVDNSVLRAEMKSIEDNVEKGNSLANSLRKLYFFPHLFIQMAETGEKSGELEKMLETGARFYEKDVDRKLGLFLQLLEPIMILVMGVVVGFVVVSSLLPIFEINRLIK